MTRGELRALFDDWVYGAYWERCPLDVSLRISRDAEDDDPRHVAYAEERLDGSTEVVLSPRLLAMPMNNVNGVIAHELGHVLDYQYDGWGIDESDDEIRADLIAQEVFGVAVRYDAHMVQTLGAGVRRPRGLR